MLCGLASTQRNDIIKYCVDNDIKAFVRPNIGDFMISNAQIIQMANLPVMICERTTCGVGYVFIKRVMDIFISLVGLIVPPALISLLSNKNSKPQHNADIMVAKQSNRMMNPLIYNQNFA